MSAHPEDCLCFWCLEVWRARMDQIQREIVMNFLLAEWEKAQHDQD